jgi:alpha-amylase
MGVILDLNYRVLKSNADVNGWPTPDSPAAVRVQHNRQNTASGWHTGEHPYGVTLVDHTGAIIPRPNVTLYERVAQDASLYANARFSAINFPPSIKGAAGIFSNGYDLTGDNYDAGSPTSPTAYGSINELRRAVAAVHSNGMQAYGDLVLHQYDGFDPTKPFYPTGADGKTRNGRFPKLPSYFVGAPPGVNVDPVPDSEGNFGFGAMASYINSTPKGAMLTGTVAAADWLAETVGFDGFRIDDVKGTNADAVLAVLNSEVMKNKYAFGEYFDGNNTNLWRWVNQDIKRRAAVLDFNFKFNVQNVCNNNSSVWMGNLATVGYCNTDPFMAVPFVESADTDNSPGEQVIWNKIMGYALMLMFPGYPRVYYRDWSTDPGCYGLMEPINNLLYCHYMYANGPFVPRLHSDPQVFVMERTGLGPGAPGCVCFYNNDQYNAYTRTVQTVYAPYTRLHEVTGKGPDIYCDAQGRTTATIPKNINGFGFLIYAEYRSPEPMYIVPIFTTQIISGAEDLKVYPIKSGTIEVGKISIKADTWLTMSCEADTSGWNDATASIIVTDPDGDEAGRIQMTNNKAGAGNHGIHCTKNGYYTITITSSLAPPMETPFRLSLTYLAS